MLTPRQLFLIVFIEGFSLGAEVLALRQLIPHVGSSIVVTAPTIGFFLLALALGYASGGRVTGRYGEVVARNFLVSAFIAAVGLAGNSVDAIFAHLSPPLSLTACSSPACLCPLAWLLGQTVPVLTNLMRHERVGEKAACALLVNARLLPRLGDAVALSSCSGSVCRPRSSWSRPCLSRVR